ncbi:protein FADD [Betta splendens]|uniref:Protein FADD n=1 Tax=Betta splendens TaxID=158456 RepID=A0A6P7M3J3_BETSP|nr:protein FADD [Betta splendens]
MTALVFNSVLLEISNQLSSQQLDDLKFLCTDIIGRKHLEKTTSGRDLFRLLTERQKLGAGDTDFLCDLLNKVHRPDLSDKLRSCESLPGSSEPDETEKAKLIIATEVIAENLARNWRKLGRKLGLSEVKLESIDRRHPCELDEIAVDVLKEWRKSKGADAQTKQLIDALRACNLNWTADKVEEKLKEQGY